MIRCLGATPAHPPTNAGSARFSTTPKVTQLAQLTPSPPIIEYYSSLHHCNRLPKFYIVVLIFGRFYDGDGNHLTSSPLPPIWRHMTDLSRLMMKFKSWFNKTIPTKRWLLH
jgi:hypothetical protein